PRRRALRRPPPALATAIVVMAAILAAIITGRTTVVRLFPQTASLFAAVSLPVNLRGLTFEGVKSTQDSKDGVAVLGGDGAIVNVTRRLVEVPRLRFAMRNGAGQEVYAWTALPARPELGPGERMEFHTRLAAPPTDGRDVIVRFFTRRDVVSGLN